MAFVLELFFFLKSNAGNAAGIALSLLGLIFLFGVALYLARRQTTDSNTLFRRWAELNKMTIIELEERHVLRGPFFPFSNNGPVVYRFKVSDAEGKIRSGFANLPMPMPIPGDTKDPLSRIEIKWD